MNIATKKRSAFGKYALILLLLFFTGMLIADPGRYMASVTRGLNLFAAAVLPSLLPFFFFSKLLTSLDVATVFSKISKKPMRFFYRAPPSSGYVLIMAMLSGYPVGAKLISELYDAKLVTASDAKTMSGFCLTSGPLFVIGTVGVTFLHNEAWGIILLVSHYLAALINGFLYRGKKPSEKEPEPVIVDYDRILSDAIMNAVLNLLIVGGYIAIFSMVTDVLYDVGLLTGFAALLQKTGLDPSLSEGIASGLVEMTRGAETIAKSSADPKLILSVMGGIVGFGGLSIALQSITFLKKAEVPVLRYLLIKLTHGILAAAIALISAFLIYG